MSSPRSRAGARSSRVHTPPTLTGPVPAGFVPTALARMRSGMNLQYQFHPQPLGRGAMLHPVFNFTQA